MSSTESLCCECGKTANEKIVLRDTEFWLCRSCFPTHGLRYRIEDIASSAIIEWHSGDHEKALEILEEMWNQHKAVDDTEWVEGVYRSVKATVLELEGAFEAAMRELEALDKLSSRAPTDRMVDKISLANILARQNESRRAAVVLEEVLAGVEASKLNTKLVLNILRKRTEVAIPVSPEIRSQCVALLVNIVEFHKLQCDLTNLETLPLEDAVRRVEKSYKQRDLA